MLDERVTSTLFPSTLGQTLNLKMSAGALSRLKAYPVFNMANELVTDNHEASILLTARYKAHEDMLRYKNRGKTESEGTIASTDIMVDNYATYKRMKPIGSRKNRSNKKRSNQSNDGMYTVNESAV